LELEIVLNIYRDQPLNAFEDLEGRLIWLQESRVKELGKILQVLERNKLYPIVVVEDISGMRSAYSALEDPQRDVKLYILKRDRLLVLRLLEGPTEEFVQTLLANPASIRWPPLPEYVAQIFAWVNKNGFKPNFFDPETIETNELTKEDEKVLRDLSLGGKSSFSE
jgi:hypothetical protein